MMKSSLHLQVGGGWGGWVGFMGGGVELSILTTNQYYD